MTLPEGDPEALTEAQERSVRLSEAGIEKRADEWYDLFARSTETRLLMTIARRANRPLSWALEMWADVDDLAAELAWDAYTFDEREARCSNCGSRHDEVYDKDGKPLPYSSVKFQRVACMVCAEANRYTATRVDEEDRKAGVRYVPTVRRPGDPFVDDDLRRHPD